MADRAKFRTDLIRWLWTYSDSLSDEDLDSEEFDQFERQLKNWACEFTGAHQPERDQCGIPDHDYCFWCGTRTPGQWKREATHG